MRRSSYPFLITSIILTITATSFSPHEGINDDVLRYTNQFRRSKGRSELRMNEELNELAKKHSEDMAKGRCGFGHSGFEKREKVARKEFRCTAFAENVAYGAESGKEVVELWEHSPGHRENLLGDYDYMGIG